VLTTATAFAPATVANLGPGFDYLGVAVEGQGDVVTATLRRDLPGGSVEISSMTGDNGRLSLVAADNCCGIAAAATLRLLGVTSVGVSLACRKGLPLGSGLGSSAASAAAAAWAVNLLFGAPLTKAQLVAAGLESEAAVSGYHADNIAPAIMGGFVLVRSYSPTLQLLQLRYGGAPSDLWFCLVTPVFEAPTREMRAALPKEISMKTHVANCAAGAGLVAGILGGDAAMLGAALGDDTIVEPARGPLIPGFAAVKAAAMAAGAFGCTISGAGPTVVAIAPDAAAGQRIAKAMADAFTSVGKLGVAYAAVAQLCAEGAQQCEPDNTGAGATDGRVIRIV
jgi:homoserine kinase